MTGADNVMYKFMPIRDTGFYRSERCSAHQANLSCKQQPEE